MKHNVRRHCIRLLEKLWKRHEPEPHHLYRYEENETMAVPEFHTGKVRHHDDAEAPEESIHYDNVAIPEVHIPHKKK